MNVRKDKIVAKLGEHDGKRCVLESKEYDSINLAKKANGLNAKTLKRGESFPPHKSALIESERKAA